MAKAWRWAGQEFAPGVAYVDATGEYWEFLPDEELTQEERYQACLTAKQRLCTYVVSASQIPDVVEIFGPLKETGTTVNSEWREEAP